MKISRKLLFYKVARPKRFELLTPWFEGRHSITRKSMICIQYQYARRPIFQQDTSL